MAAQMQEQATDQIPTGFDPEKALEQPLTLLRSKDDTYKFVGLALLKSILDNQQSLREDPQIIAKCWSAISPKFLDALLKASESHGRSKQEAQNMIELAVAVIHAFIVLLPPEIRQEVRTVGRTPGLVNALLRSSPDTTVQILEILLTFASEVTGAGKLLELDAETLASLYELSVREPLVLDIIKHALLTRITAGHVSHNTMRQTIEETISALVRSFRGAEPTHLFLCLDDILDGVPSWVHGPGKWLSPLTAMIHSSIVNSQRDSASHTRTSALMLSATLLRLYRGQASALLFRPSVSVLPSLDGKPFVYLFMKLLLVDIQTTTPALLDMLTSPTFASTCKRLAASYDILVGFIGYLLESLDHNDTNPHGTTDSPLPSDLLLKLRTDIAETMSLTIEYLRDRYDAALSGPSHSRASSGFSAASGQSNNPALILPTDVAAGSGPEVQLAAAQLRALGLWLREDENERLRKEAVGIIDVLLTIYSTTTSDDVRSPIIVALQGIATVPEGVETFLEKREWSFLFEDLKLALDPSDAAEKHEIRAIEIIRLFLAIVESTPHETQPNEWMSLIPVSVGGAMLSPTNITFDELDLRISSWQLAIELLTRASTAVRRKYLNEARKMIDLARRYLEGSEERLQVGLREVVDGIEGLYPEFGSEG